MKEDIAFTAGMFRLRGVFHLNDIYETVEETKAIEHYEKFLDIWKDAHTNIWS